MDALDARRFAQSAREDSRAGLVSARPAARYIVTLRRAPDGPEGPKCDSSIDGDFVATLAVNAMDAAEACADAIRRYQSVNPSEPIIATIVH